MHPNPKRGRVTGPLLSDIPQMTKSSVYATDVPLGMLDSYLKRQIEESGLELEPDFQRGHVWTPKQKTAFVEFKLRGGRSGREIYMNHTRWGNGASGGWYVLVDGLQRITTMLEFLRGEVKAFGYTLEQFRDHDILERSMEHHLSFRINVNDLKTREEVLKWYLEMNTGGTPHSPEEIARVKKLYAQSRKGK